MAAAGCCGAARLCARGCLQVTVRFCAPIALLKRPLPRDAYTFSMMVVDFKRFVETPEVVVREVLAFVGADGRR